MRQKIAIGIGGLLFVAYLSLILLNGPKAQVVGPVNQVFCNQIGTLTSNNIVTTQVVSGTANQTIYVCGWHITNTGASGTWAIVTGTGTNCGTGQVTTIPGQNVTSNAPSADHIDYAQFSLPAGNALCITPSVNTIAGVIYFAKF